MASLPPPSTCMDEVRVAALLTCFLPTSFQGLLRVLLHCRQEPGTAAHMASLPPPDTCMDVEVRVAALLTCFLPTSCHVRCVCFCTGCRNQAWPTWHLCHRQAHAWTRFFALAAGTRDGGSYGIFATAQHMHGRGSRCCVADLFPSDFFPGFAACAFALPAGTRDGGSYGIFATAQHMHGRGSRCCVADFK